MRILQISDVFFPRVNGVSTSIETFRSGLADEGVEVTLIAPRYGGEPDQRGILRIPARKVPLDPEDRLMSRRALLAAGRQLAGQGFAAVHVHTPFAAHYAGVALARRLDLPLVLSYHTLFEEYLHHYIPLVPRALTALAARSFSRAQCAAAQLVIAPTEPMRERLQAYRVHAPIEVLPTGVSLEAFATGDRGRFRRILGIEADRPVALYVGRLAHEKNIGFLLDMLAAARARCPRVLLLVAGEGPAEPSLRQRVAACGLDGAVRFLGYLDRGRELPDCYACADLFVFASRTETQGLVLLEAMASGLPVLALSAMGTRAIVDPECGALVAPDDPAGFALMLAGLLESPRHLGELSREARGFAARWSCQAMASRLAGLYRGLLDGPRETVSGRPDWKARTRGRPA